MELIHGGLEGQLMQSLLRGAGGLEQEKKGEEAEGRQEQRVEEEEEADKGGERIRRMREGREVGR